MKNSDGSLASPAPSRAAEPEAWKFKPLEWVVRPIIGGEDRIMTKDGRYWLSRVRDGFMVIGNDEQDRVQRLGPEVYATKEEAQAVVQADHEQRTSEYLESAPQAVAPAEEIAELVQRLKAAESLLVGDYAYKQARACRDAATTLTSLATELEIWRSVKHSSHWKARLTASEAEASDLRRKLEEAEAARPANDAILQATIRRAEAAERKLKEARKALEPFAAQAGRYDPPEDDDNVGIWGGASITLGMLRAARRALTTDGGA